MSGLKPRSALRGFLQSEAAGGVLLMAAALAALGVANSPLAPAYADSLGRYVGPFSVQHWINDGLMALFFLLVGLEIKREMVDGHLATWADRRLPILAAVAGMIVPALVFLAVTQADPALARGWAVPAATDIAFAIGVLALLGSRVPASLKLLLTTIAIVDDMGAVAIIAIGYTAQISGFWLLMALVILAGMFALNRLSISHPAAYALGFVLLWFAVLQSGVHATVAGVLAAFCVPVRITKARPDDAQSTLHRMEHALQGPVAFFIVPLFGFANAGVALGSAPLTDALPLGIALGLFLGKQLGIFGAIWLAVRLGFAAMPAHTRWPQIYGLALLCGIGFTMSLFIGDLAFDDPLHSDEVKLGVLMGSLASAVAGALVLRFAGAKKGAA
ncbi:MAG: Na+/H+ antiporter NhaA [Alphaproteobacteria bacterium]|jgi:NhaA family Na+:H+ antiporter|nr:Na+/H+ antiporter NhaA [Alphaproteobacteria bacterium]